MCKNGGCAGTRCKLVRTVSWNESIISYRFGCRVARPALAQFRRPGRPWPRHVGGVSFCGRSVIQYDGENSRTPSDPRYLTSARVKCVHEYALRMRSGERTVRRTTPLPDRPILPIWRRSVETCSTQVTCYALCRSASGTHTLLTESNVFFCLTQFLLHNRYACSNWGWDFCHRSRQLCDQIFYIKSFFKLLF